LGGVIGVTGKGGKLLVFTEKELRKEYGARLRHLVWEWGGDVGGLARWAPSPEKAGLSKREKEFRG